MRPGRSEAVRDAQTRALALALQFRRGAAVARREGRADHANEAEQTAARLLARVHSPEALALLPSGEAPF